MAFRIISLRKNLGFRRPVETGRRSPRSLSSSERRPLANRAMEPAAHWLMRAAAHRPVVSPPEAIHWTRRCPRPPSNGGLRPSVFSLMKSWQCIGPSDEGGRSAVMQASRPTTSMPSCPVVGAVPGLLPGPALGVRAVHRPRDSHFFAECGSRRVPA